MKDVCECKETFDLKVEADISADAIWCNNCYFNFEMEDILISIDLKKELLDWTLLYGEWIDWDNDGIVPNGIKLEEEHNKYGLKLTKKVQKEFGSKYKVSFSPSTYAKY